MQILIDSIERVDEAKQLLREHGLTAVDDATAEHVVTILDEEETAVTDLLDQDNIEWQYADDLILDDEDLDEDDLLDSDEED